MALTDARCRTAKAREKAYKLADAHGLYLLVKPNGSRLWRMKYRIAGKEKALSFGPYPEISLIDARARREEARKQLRQDMDPGAERKTRKAASNARALNTFELLARAWLELQASVRDKRYAEQVESRLVRDVFPSIGSMAVTAITTPLVLELLRRIEQRGALEMARKVRMHVSHVFDWALSAGLAEVNPAARVGRALKPRHAQRRPAVLSIEQARQVLTATEALDGIWWATRLASRLTALTAARPGTIRLAERSEFEDLDGPEPRWRIPAHKLKLKAERKADAKFDFVSPLSRQAVETAQAAIAASYACQSATGAQWLFPGVGSWKKPISDSTMSGHYLDAGLSGIHVPHGWRASFSTIMNERAAQQGRPDDRAIIDMMLAHMKEDVEAAYNRAAYMPRRRELAQAWADMLMEGLPSPTALLSAREAGHDGAAQEPRRASRRSGKP